MSAPVSVEVQLAVERFLYREAALLDDGDFEAWLKLFDAEVYYEAPLNDVAPDHGATALKIISDGYEQLALRVARLGTGLAHAEQPRSRTRRHLGNILVDLNDDETLAVRSNLLLYQSRLERSEALISAVRFDRLVAHGDSYRIVHRHVVLDQRLLPRALSVFL